MFATSGVTHDFLSELKKFASHTLQNTQKSTKRSRASAASRIACLPDSVALLLQDKITKVGVKIIHESESN
jgi:hypothetical protein|tara:strand:+ start:705 stop:917 length:213 start_codon:yes stop_codon:yes gene_type:complete